MKYVQAAELDGCTRVQRAWYITLPTIRPLIVMMLLLNIGGLLGSDFQQIFTYIGSNSTACFFSNYRRRRR